MVPSADFLLWVGDFVASLIGHKPTVEVTAPAGQAAFGWPWMVFFELSLLQFALNWGLRVLVVQPIAKWYMMKVAVRPRRVTYQRVVKFSQATLETFFYSVYFVMGYRVAGSQPWIWPSAKWWENQPDNRTMSPGLRFFYIAYAARYFQNFVMVFLEPVRKDFWEMQIHHSVTVVLIYLSYTYGFYRVGVVIMVLLDIADPPLHLAKQSVYIKELVAKSSSVFSWATIADMFFVLFAVSFTVTRIMMYPYVVWSVTVELYREKGGPGSFDLWDYRERIGDETIGCIILVWILFILQVFWKRLLGMAVYKVLSGGEVADNRSDSELSDSEPEPNKKTK